MDFSGFSNFVNKYYLEPIRTDAGYNWVDGPTYAVLFIVVAWLLFLLFRKIKLEIDLKFFYAALPFIILGSCFRTFVDKEIYPVGFWTVSPGLYFIVLGIFLALFLVSRAVWRENYWKACLGFGIILAIANIAIVFSKLKLERLFAGVLVLGIFTTIIVVLYFIFHLLKTKWAKDLGFLAISTHLLDASVSFVAVDLFNFWQKWPLPRFFHDTFHTAGIMIPLKLIILTLFVYFVRKDIKDKQLSNLLLVLVALLGLAQGLRDLLTLVL